MRAVFHAYGIALLLFPVSCSRSPLAPVKTPESSWSVLGTCENLVDVSGFSGTDVYALGHLGTLLHYDGSHWTASLPFQASLDYWSDLLCTSPPDMFAVGNTRTFVGGNPVYSYEMFHFDGSVTSRMNLDTSTPIRDLWGTASDNVVVAGGNGMIRHYDGNSWTSIASGTTSEITAIWGLPSGVLFAALEHAVRFYDGSSWTEILSTTESLHDIWACAPDDAYAVGPNGTILHYDGLGWTLTRVPYSPAFRKVMGSASNDVYVTGGNVIYHYDGQSWQVSYGMYGLDIASLWESADGEVFTVGNGEDEFLPPTIFHSDGVTWNRELTELLLPFNRDLSAISGTDKDIYVGGGYVGLLRFDGSLWRRLYMDDGNGISDLWASSADTLIAIGDYGEIALLLEGAGLRVAQFPGGLTDVWGSDPRHVFLVGWDGTILHFDGATLASMVSNTMASLNDVWGRSASEVYAVGDAGTILRYDGRSWQPMVSNTTASLQGIWGDPEYAVAVGSRGTLLRLEGETWLPMESPSFDSLTAVWGSSSNDIYAVGLEGSLHYDGSRWQVVSQTLGGSHVWGRDRDDVYVLQRYRILHHGRGLGPGT